MQKIHIIIEVSIIANSEKQDRRKKKGWVLSIGMGLWVFGCPAEEKEKKEKTRQDRDKDKGTAETKTKTKTRANAMGLLHSLAGLFSFLFLHIVILQLQVHCPLHALTHSHCSLDTS